ncbi:MAG: DNRLRE domain-containing protein [Sedimentisphaerales bacterium]|nr:DNRLRE domain-containing protein [Sedimentisphaerales bacterium]
MKRLIFASLLVLFFAGVACAADRTVKFVNKTNKTADDLDIETKQGVTITSKSPFTSDRGVAGGNEHNLYGGPGVEPDANATVTFDTGPGGGKTIEIKRWWWTKGGNALKDGYRISKVGGDSGGSTLSCSSGPSTGNGQVVVRINGNDNIFTVPSANSVEQTASDFSDFLKNIKDGGFALVHSNLCTSSCVAFAGNLLGDPNLELSAEITAQDSTLPLVLQNLGASGTITVNPIEDSFVEDIYPNSNYGGWNLVYIGDENTDHSTFRICRAYLKFDLSCIPSGSTITSAKLHMGTYMSGGSDPPIDVEAHYLSDDSWTEYGITWNNAPTTFSGPQTDSEVVEQAHHLLCCDCWCLTEDVQTALDDDGILSEVLKKSNWSETNTHSWCNLGSRENSMAIYVPYLEIEYEVEEPEDPAIKWKQLPDLTETGVDVKMFWLPLADDFNCIETGPIEGISIWTSFENNNLPDNGVGSLTLKLSIYDDIPAGVMAAWSMPGATLWTRDFSPGEYTVRRVYEGLEDWYDPLNQLYNPADHNEAYQYTFYIDPCDAFVQQGDPCSSIIYWLGVEDISTENDYCSGWKSSVFPAWNDDAVYMDDMMMQWKELTYPPGHTYEYDSIGLAFTIFGKVKPDMDAGDAPDSNNNSNAAMTTYSGIQANFPTVYMDPVAAGPFGPIHEEPLAVAYLGNGVSLEVEADLGPDQDPNNNIDPSANLSNQDGYDDGVLNMPLNLPYCRWTTFDCNVSVINPGTDLYVNAWFDFNRDGDWDDVNDCYRGPAQEWAVQNQVLTGLQAGVHKITTPAFLSWHPQGGSDAIWMRITLSEQPWNGGSNPGTTGNGGSGPQAGYKYGETEDYYFIPDTSCSECPDLNCDRIVDFKDMAILTNLWLQNCP